MKRLTKREILGNAYFPKCFEEPCNGCGCQDDDCDYMGDICEKLASYEDTGLTPEQIIEIDKLYAEKCRELEDERKKNEWIPCSERLPEVEDLHEISIEDCACYLIQRRFGVMDVAHYIKVYGEPYFEAHCMKFKDVIAWKPLPKPYRPERSNT